MDQLGYFEQAVGSPRDQPLIRDVQVPSGHRLDWIKIAGVEGGELMQTLLVNDLYSALF